MEKKYNKIINIIHVQFFSSRFAMNFLFILILCVLNINAYKQENDDDEEFIDIGVRLTGDNRDYLIADLIAEEKDIFNAGHVSIKNEISQKMSCFFCKQIPGIGLHHFRIQRKHTRRSKRAIDQTIEDLKQDERVIK